MKSIWLALVLELKALVLTPVTIPFTLWLQSPKALLRLPLKYVDPGICMT
eukprot:CAMPEP_0174373342 /NCGR_PEP_ID=MMETSP0811_2-20130205/106723_1 /TAXON_ID=73025 ORGANISM="Eutreptiella gymnastica-like, Strain CCMP1594" /NCGR_SAMPLE_ID=MMETSP0811_2 /ASSEMBLY_ACC=CAM_ASM_000667 /LENGTH=49 /DNA_ID= /DNA_START= /DNA_END= /DNA_ORIENTATION=